MLTIFTQIDQPGRLPGICWQASHYDGFIAPVALAWISIYPDFTQLVFILVPDQFRRLGHAKSLIQACMARWPDLEFTDPISPEGERLLDSIFDVN